MRKSSPKWTPEEIEKLKALYPNHATQDLVPIFNRSLHGINGAAFKLGIKKSEAHQEALREWRRQRYLNDPAFKATQLRKGHTPWNKGQPNEKAKYLPHAFKPGMLQGWANENVLPVGTYRVYTGDLYRKINTTGTKNQQWKKVSRLVWEAANGPVPPGHIVLFKPGKHTTKLEDIRLENIECITRREQLERNSFLNYPAEFRGLISVLAHLRNKIKRKEDHEKHNDGCAKSPMRNDGSPE